MNLYMRDIEMRRLGYLTRTVNCIRDINDEKFYQYFVEKYGKELVDKAIQLIKEHPDWSDEDVASKLLEDD